MLAMTPEGHGKNPPATPKTSSQERFSPLGAACSPTVGPRRIDGVEPLGFSATTDLKSAPQDRLGSIRHSYVGGVAV
jgi:hypothetical protein